MSLNEIPESIVKMKDVLIFKGVFKKQKFQIGFFLKIYTLIHVVISFD